jgi:hypothetical protein
MPHLSERQLPTMQHKNSVKLRIFIDLLSSFPNMIVAIVHTALRLYSPGKRELLRNVGRGSRDRYSGGF